jgi:Fuc2NAc and GlcNAc transferase
MCILPFVAIFSLFFSAAIVALICRLGPRINLLDMPNHRSSHSIPTPRGGGIGVVLAFILVGIMCAKVYTFIAACVAVALIGLASDLFDISSGIRLILHIALAFVMALLAAGFLWLSAGWAVVPFIVLSVIFIAGSANIYNFMDGINGIAAITAVVAFGLLAFYSASNMASAFPLTILAVSIVFSSLGFLYFNIPNAKIFIGDVGALFLGFTFASMTIMLSRNILDFICLSSFLFTFYADEIITMCLRISAGQNLFLPHRRHFYQILVNEAGLPHWKVSCGYGAAQLIIGLSILLLRPFGALAVVGALMFYFIAFIGMNVSLRQKIRVQI